VLPRVLQLQILPIRREQDNGQLLSLSDIERGGNLMIGHVATVKRTDQIKTEIASPMGERSVFLFFIKNTEMWVQMVKNKNKW